MRRARWLLLVLLPIIVLSAIALTEHHDLSVREVYSLPDQSKVEVCGTIARVQTKSGVTSPRYANFKVWDETCQIHVFWWFPSSGRPAWFKEDATVIVSGTYHVSHPEHPKEPEIVATSVSPIEVCTSDAVPIYYAPAEPYTITTWGAAGEVAGSCYQVTTADKSILIDCGSFMTTDETPFARRSEHHDTDPFPFDPTSIDAVLLTHAHDDHMARLHYLVYDGFDGPIYMTEATAAIFYAKLDDLVDYSCIPEAKRASLKDYAKSRIKTVSYGETKPIVEGIKAIFIDAGHIPGSASIVLNIEKGSETHTVTFSGDIGSGYHPFLNPPDLASLTTTGTETLVIESTYGASPPREYPDNLYEDFYHELLEALERRDLVVIPTFALDRTQRVLAAIGQGMEAEQLPDNLRVAVGGKSSCYLTKVYIEFQEKPKTYEPYFSETFWREKPLGQEFWEYLRGNDCRDWQKEGKETNFKQFNIIVTPSGTGSSSLSKTLITRFIQDSSVTFIKVGWAPPSSPMGQLGKDYPSVISIDGQTYHVRAKIVNMHGIFSGHADRNMLLKFIGSFPDLQTVIITHGEDTIKAREDLEEAIRVHYPRRIEVIKPMYRQRIDLFCLGESQ